MPAQVVYEEGVNTLLPLKCEGLLVYCHYLPAEARADTKLMPNQWHLAACAGDRAVAIDCFPRNNRARKCVLVIRADQPSMHTDIAIAYYISLPITKSCSLQGVVNAIIDKGRARFRFAAGGRGARHWLRTIVGDLETAQFVAAGSWEKVDLNLMDVHFSITQKSYCDIQCGTFYSAEVESDDEQSPR